MENGRHRISIFAMEIMDAHTLSKKLDTVFEKLKCAAKLSIAFGFVLKNVEDGACRYYYAHENNTVMERSKLVATKEGLVKVKNVLSNIDLIEACTEERAKKIEILQTDKYLCFCFSTQKGSIWVYKRLTARATYRKLHC